MPLRPGRSKKTLQANFHELRQGQTFAHTARKFGKRRAEKQMIAIALSTARKTGRNMSDARR
jgi:hypothetical protein